MRQSSSRSRTQENHRENPGESRRMRMYENKRVFFKEMITKKIKLKMIKIMIIII